MIRRIWLCAVRLLFALVLLSNSLAIAYAENASKAYVYCISKSFSSEILSNYFKNRSDCAAVFHDLDDSTLKDRFLEIAKTLTVLGVEIVPPDACLPCVLKDLTWDEILVIYGSPLIGFFHQGRLAAITVGITNNESLDKALAVNDEDVKVFTLHRVYSLTNERIQLEEFFLDKPEIGFSDLILPITLLALADSVNPCTFAIFTAILLMTLHFLGKMRTAAIGFSFVSAVFTGYYVLGLGLFSILVTVTYIGKVLAVIGLVLGVFKIVRCLKMKYKSPVQGSLHKFIESKVRNAYASIISAFFLGLVASFTLLPCSGGPYIVGLGLLSTLKDSAQTYLLLTLYNLLFVAPLILILTVILASSTLSYKIKVLRSTNLAIMELVNGALLAIICIYLIVS